MKFVHAALTLIALTTVACSDAHTVVIGSTTVDLALNSSTEVRLWVKETNTIDDTPSPDVEITAVEVSDPDKVSARGVGMDLLLVEGRAPGKSEIDVETNFGSVTLTVEVLRPDHIELRSSMQAGEPGKALPDRFVAGAVFQAVAVYFAGERALRGAPRGVEFEVPDVVSISTATSQLLARSPGHTRLSAAAVTGPELWVVSAEEVIALDVKPLGSAIGTQRAIGDALPLENAFYWFDVYGIDDESRWIGLGAGVTATAEDTACDVQYNDGMGLSVYREGPGNCRIHVEFENAVSEIDLEFVKP